ncbi:hypothetical protein BGX27_001296 [Mortierella sp. AM989]|nr:hypothetical protein BGX27_001296 [Mortierella sp. AM989]
MTSPVELPEMLFYLAPFVVHEDIPACLRVCRQWNISFTPSLWHSIKVPQDWSQSPSFPPLHILQKNAQYVRYLTLKAIEGLAPFLQRCNGLKTLVVFGEQIAIPCKPHLELWDELTSLIKHNPTIEWIVFGFSLSTAPSTTFLRALPDACPNLKRYESSQGRYDDPDQIEALMQAISNLRTVSFRYEYFVNVHLSKRWTMPYLHELTLKDARGLSTQSQVDLVCQCPSLRHLKWTVCRDALFPAKEFCKRVPKACPELCQLQLDGCGLPDPDDIGRMLDSISRLELLALCGSSITKRTFNSLIRHFGVLRSLDIMYCSQVKSWMAQRILEECPNLTKFLSSVLLMQDIFQGKTWAAVKLRHLEINFVQSSWSANPTEEIKETFKQLSRLTRLRILSTGCRGRARKRGLMFKTELGMDQLKTLTKLTTLNLGVPFHQMSEADVIWVGAHLENLTRVEGVFHTEWSQHLHLADRFRGFGIDVPEKNEDELEFFSEVANERVEDGNEDISEDEETDYSYEEEEEIEDEEEAGHEDESIEQSAENI